MIKVRRHILEEIRKDRENNLVDKDLIKQAILQFIYMGFGEKTELKKIDGAINPITWTCAEKNLERYDNQFEEYLKQNTTEFYRHKAEDWSNSMSCHEYIIKIS